MIGSLSQTDKAIRDTTITHSTGSAFRDVVKLYGLPYPGEVLEADWREAARVMAFGPRGTPGATLAFCEAVLASHNTELLVSYSSAFPALLTPVSGAFTADQVGRWLRLESDGNLYRIASVSAGNATLTTVATSLWSGANWTNSTAETSTATVLPFTIVERVDGRVEVLTYVQGLLPPGTYMQPGSTTPPAPSSVAGDTSYNSGSMDPVPDADPLIGAEARTVGVPEGGHVQADELEHGDQTLGPYPIYLTSGKVLPGTTSVLDAQLASGIECVFRDDL